MSSRRIWLDTGERRPIDALGYMGEACEDAESVLVIVADRMGEYQIRTFGSMGLVEIAAMATLLGHVAADRMLRDDD